MASEAGASAKRQPPEELLVLTSNGHFECGGRYTLVADTTVNAMPLWQQTDGEHWMFSGLETCLWLVGGSDEEQLGFRCDTGFIASNLSHKGAYPDMIVGGWQRDDGEEWLQDPSVQVISQQRLLRPPPAIGSPRANITTDAQASPNEHPSSLVVPPDLLYVVSPNGEVECEGEYHLINGQLANRLPLWKKEGGDRWLFSSLGGVWLIGGTGERELEFQCIYGYISASEPHGGRMPHEMCVVWQRDDPNVGLIQDADVKVMLSLDGDADGDGETVAKRVPPESLVVLSGPKASPESDKWRGRYKIVSGKLTNGFPIWKKVDGEVWLFSGLSGMWLIGGSDEHEKEFACDEGFVASSTTHCGTMPHWITSGWQRDEGDEWVEDTMIRIASEEFLVAEAPRVLYLSSPSGQELCAGQYDLVIGETPNGMPLWRQQDGEHWLFSGTRECWLVGGLEEKAQRFLCDDGLIAGVDRHGGRMPHEQGTLWTGWQRDDIAGWLVDPAIEFTEQLEDLVPKQLLLKGPTEVQSCSGTYVLRRGERANGFPVWRQESGDCNWLFSSKSGVWIVGGASEVTRRIIGAKRHGGAMPDRCGDGWAREMDASGRRAGGGGGDEVYDDGSGCWVVDPEINVLLPGSSPSAAEKPSATWPQQVQPVENMVALQALTAADELFVASMALQSSGGTGIYELYPGVVNGCPVWRKRNGEEWLFSTPEGRWVVGGDSERAVGFRRGSAEANVLLAAAQPHGGVMPEHYRLGWLRCCHQSSGDQLLPDSTVEITAGAVRAETASPTTPPKPPQSLRVCMPKLHNMPGLSVSHQPFFGDYELVQGIVNHFPTWKQQSGPYWLYSGPNDRWHIGCADDASVASPFQTRSEVWSRRAHNGAWPDSSGGWTPFPILVVERRIAHPIASHSSHPTQPPSRAGDGGAPEMFWISMPIERTSCGGRYVIVAKKHVNGMPVWRQCGGRYHLFASAQRLWLFGIDVEDQDELRSDDNLQPLVRSAEDHCGLFPNSISRWEVRGNDGDENWVAETSLCLLQEEPSVPPVLHVLSPSNERQCAGRYEIATGCWVNGFPLWKQIGREHRIFSAWEGGHWLIGGTREEAFEFAIVLRDHSGRWPKMSVADDVVEGGIIASSEAHVGRMPHELGGSCAWQCDTGNDWKFDPSIRIVDHMQAQMLGVEAYPWPEMMQLARKSHSDTVPSTALHVAALTSQADACLALLDDHACGLDEINASDGEGRTALHVAALNGSVAVCEVLLNHRRFGGANMQDFGGWTALHCAAWRGHAEVCELLLEHPTFTAVEAIDVIGRTALDLDVSMPSTGSGPLTQRVVHRNLPKARRREMREKRRQAVARAGAPCWDAALDEEGKESASGESDFHSGEEEDDAVAMHYWRNIVRQEQPLSAAPASVSPQPSVSSRIDDKSLAVFAKERSETGGAVVDAGQALVDKITRMEQRIRVLENVTAAFWAAAPSDEDLKADGCEQRALERWREAKQGALKAMKDTQMEAVEDLEERARVMALLESERSASRGQGERLPVSVRPKGREGGRLDVA